uniref:Uncharacterized protein n=1 Tax=Globisporangium ultimum (strain ATCC 200006 / CBS 805.95 / DAOM BR144) TaxID=431595 RepID=K3WNF2_GLOUD
MTVALLNGLFCAALLIACMTPAVFARDLPTSSSTAFVHVQNDAVFSVQGPVCSGDAGGQPLGWNCPKKGDSAIDSCMKGIKSFTDGVSKCVAPVDAECRVIAETGAWGCAWPIKATNADSSSSPEVAASTLGTPSESAPTPTHSLRSSTSTIALSVDASSTTGSQTTSSALVWIGSAAAGAVAVAAILAAVIISKKRKANTQRKSSESGLADIVITPENAPVVTPKTSKTVFVYTAHI